MKKFFGSLFGQNQKVTLEQNSMQTSEDRKTALESYLTFYEGLQNPRYAVLVTGEWGVGKTFQVRRAIPDERCYYISLFGMNKPEDIEAAVFSQMHPTKAAIRAVADKAEKTSFQGIPVGSLGNAALRFLLRGEIKNDRTIIFDDLERSGIDSKILLGIINLYVEHHQCRVVVIAHDGKLSGDLIEQKEKIFGQVVKAYPQDDLAYIEFMNSINDPDEKKILIDIQPIIINLFRYSDVFSLRILRHVMEDTLRLMRCMTAEQRNHLIAIREIAAFFAAMNFECRSNRLTANDLVDRIEKEFAYQATLGRNEQNNVEEPPIVAAAKRYSTIRLDSNYLSDDVLREMLFDGVYSKERISHSINSTSFFAKPALMPSWRAFIEFQDQSEEAAIDAMHRLNNDFNERNILDPGEMLHMFALRMMLAHNKLLDHNVAETTNSCKQYIDDLLRAGTLKPKPTAWADREEIGHGYQGFGYWVEDAYRREWKEIFDYLENARHSVMLESLREATPEILDLVEKDGQKLYSILNHTASNIEKYAGVPLLEFIDPERFVDAWLRSHPRNWYWIQQSLMERFKHNQGDKIQRELPFVDKVAQLMREEAERVGGIRRLQINRRIPHVPR